MTYDEALRKAMACLRLSERGGTPEEAAAAAAKAQEIITKYQLDISDVDFDQKRADEDREPIKDFGYEDPLDQPKAKDFSKEMLMLAKYVAYFNQCFVAYRKQDTYSLQFRIVGRTSNVQTVRYLYGFYKAQILDLVNRCTKGNSHTYKGQFCMGVVDAIYQEAQEKQTFANAKSEQANNPLALVRVNNAVERIQKLRQDVVAFNMQVRKANGWSGGGVGFNGSRTSTGGREHGRREGANIRTTGAKSSLGSGSNQLH